MHPSSLKINLGSRLQGEFGLSVSLASKFPYPPQLSSHNCLHSPLVLSVADVSDEESIFEHQTLFLIIVSF